MKKLLLINVIAQLIVLSAYAQPTITLSTFQGYTFADRFSTEFGPARVDDGFQWGGGLEVGLSKTTAIELIYQYLGTTASYQSSQRLYTGTIDLNYILLGGTRYYAITEKLSGFGTVNVGMGIFNPSDALSSNTITKLSVGGRLGLCFFASDKINIKIHAQLLSPVQWVGGGYYFGTGGSGVGISTGSTIYQFYLGGGINYRIK